MIVVHRNEGNTESFHVNVPMDRIMIGAPSQGSQLPAGLKWPDDEQFAIPNEINLLVRKGLGRTRRVDPHGGDAAHFRVRLRWDSTRQFGKMLTQIRDEIRPLRGIVRIGMELHNCK